MSVLLTGGAGYIGSHIAVSLIQHGYDVVILDNFSNSHPEVIEKIFQIAGKRPPVIVADIRQTNLVTQTLKKYGCSSVIHLAGLKSVGESCLFPLKYYDHNVVGGISLLQAMSEARIYNLIFSSTATVYGKPLYLPFDEKHPLKPESVYAETKKIIEKCLHDLHTNDDRWRIAILRYFNPVGAHKTGLIGENPVGIPNNLMPLIAQVAQGIRSELTVHGNDYETRDGTGIRDYIHILDLSEAHVLALKSLEKFSYNVLNIGRGEGYSVLELIKIFEYVSNQKIDYKIGPRRPGDIAEMYCNPKKAENILGWKSLYGLQEICFDMWNFQKNNTEKKCQIIL